MEKVKPDIMDLLRKLATLFNRKEKITFGFLFFFLLIGALLETVGIGLIIPFLGVVTTPEIIFENRILHYFYTALHFQSTNAFLVFVALSMLGIFVLKSIYLFVFYLYQYKFLYAQQAKLGARLLNVYLTKPYTYHLQKNSAEMLRNLNTEVFKVFSYIIGPALLLLSELLVVLSVFMLMLVAAPVTTLLSAVIMAGVVGIFFKFFRKKLTNTGKKEQQNYGEMIKWVNQGLGASKEIKVSGRERFFIEAFSAHAKVYAHSLRFFQLINQTPRLFIETMVVSTILMIILFIILRGQGIESLISTIALYAMSAFRLMPSMNRIVTALSSVRYNKPALDVVYQDLIADEEALPAAEEAEGNDFPTGKPRFRHSIRVEHVYYRYPGADRHVLEDITLDVPIGKSVAFVGESGAGKTTLVDIILGLLEPDKGRVSVDGVSIYEQLPVWKKSIGYIAQNIYLSDDTIRRNVAFGIPEEMIDDKAVWKALEAAQLKEFVEQSPEKLDMFVGERGVRLSGGQRQRIGIARALYHDPEVLFLDEATSALDNATESEVMKAIELLRGQKTLIIIAHRLSTIENCDIVFELKDGALVRTSIARVDA